MITMRDALQICWKTREELRDLAENSREPFDEQGYRTREILRDISAKSDLLGNTLECWFSDKPKLNVSQQARRCECCHGTGVVLNGFGSPHYCSCLDS